MSLFENYGFGSINKYVLIYNLDFTKLKGKLEEGKFDITTWNDLSLKVSTNVYSR